MGWQYICFGDSHETRLRVEATDRSRNGTDPMKPSVLSSIGGLAESASQ